MRVLLVEDHQESRIALGRLLRMTGCRTSLAANFAEARCLLREQDFDVLLIDLVLPDGSGLDLMHEFRALTSAAAIALTGMGEEHLAADCTAAGFGGRLLKPVVFDDLWAAIQEALPHHPVTSFDEWNFSPGQRGI